LKDEGSFLLSILVNKDLLMVILLVILCVEEFYFLGGKSILTYNQLGATKESSPSSKFSQEADSSGSSLNFTFLDIKTT